MQTYSIHSRVKAGHQERQHQVWLNKCQAWSCIGCCGSKGWIFAVLSSINQPQHGLHKSCPLHLSQLLCVVTLPSQSHRTPIIRTQANIFIWLTLVDANCTLCSPLSSKALQKILNKVLQELLKRRSPRSTIGWMKVPAITTPLCQQPCTTINRYQHNINKMRNHATSLTMYTKVKDVTVPGDQLGFQVHAGQHHFAWSETPSNMSYWTRSDLHLKCKN